MLLVEGDAMLVVVNVGRILHSPRISTDGYRDRSVVLTRRIIYASYISLRLKTKVAFGISRLYRRLCRRNIARILFGLGKIYGDIDNTVLALTLPTHILLYSIHSYIVGVL